MKSRVDILLFLPEDLLQTQGKTLGWFSTDWWFPLFHISANQKRRQFQDILENDFTEVQGTQQEIEANTVTFSVSFRAVYE